MTLFLRIRLVDADRINPKRPWLIYKPNLANAIPQINYKANKSPIATNHVVKVWDAPDIRDCFKFRGLIQVHSGNSTGQWTCLDSPDVEVCIG